MIWVTREFKIDGWFEAQEIFEKHFERLGSPKGMMLLAKSNIPYKRLFICLPEEDLLANYTGFESISEADLPENPELIIGHDDAFREKFAFGV